MPLGHVEKDIYTGIKENSFDNFSFTKQQTTLKKTTIHSSSFDEHVSAKND